MRGRTVAIALASAGVLVMSWAVWTPLRRVPESAPGARSGAAAAKAASPGDALEVHADRLRRPDAQAPAPLGSRNPFTFRTPDAPPLPRGAPPEARPPALVVPAGPVAPAGPQAPFSLSGIAERTTENGPTRIAVLAAPRALYHVEQGGVVLRRYRVTAITATTVTLLDLETGRAFDLVLKAR